MGHVKTINLGLVAFKHEHKKTKTLMSCSSNHEIQYLNLVESRLTIYTCSQKIYSVKGKPDLITFWILYYLFLCAAELLFKSY